MSNEVQIEVTTPEWVRHAIFYQIFPERFANGDPANDPKNAQPWGTPPTPSNFMGGDLQGVIEKLDYLQDLGITAIYLCPIFIASSNHKYNTADYFTIDPRFGTMDTFKQLVNEMHQRNMKLVLDGVFNHCGRGLFPFNDVLENGADSPYLNWFHIEKFPLAPYDGKRKANYKSWWNIRSLPKFNTDNPDVRRYILDVARFWIEQGADGWRLDVPNEIDDHDFWREFRRVVKAANPDAYIVGEIWEDGEPWLQGDQFDAVMNYLFRSACLEYFAEDKATADVFAAKIEELNGKYPLPVTLAQLNLIGSHDTARYFTMCQEDVGRVKLTLTFQMTYSGAPCVYYGDEIGVPGEGDPHCRACFPWDEDDWNKEIREHTKAMIAFRKAHPALRDGDFRTLYADVESNVYVFARTDAKETIVIALNPTLEAKTIDVELGDLPKSENLQRQEDGAAALTVQDGKIVGLEVPARGSVIAVGL